MERMSSLFLYQGDYKLKDTGMIRKESQSCKYFAAAVEVESPEHASQFLKQGKILKQEKGF